MACACSLLAAVFFLPVAVTLVQSLRFGEQPFTLGQYRELLVVNYTFLRHFWYSLGYALVVSAVCVAVALPLGFVFAKVRFPGSNALFFVYILVMMLPFQATLLPNFILLQSLRLLQTPWALILPAMFAPMAVFMLRQFCRTIPDECLDAALMDTASATRILRSIVWPQVKPAAAALTVILFCESWNMVEQVMIFTSENPDIHPLSVVLSRMPADVSFAGAVVYMYPALALYLLFRETLHSALAKLRW